MGTQKSILSAVASISAAAFNLPHRYLQQHAHAEKLQISEFLGWHSLDSLLLALFKFYPMHRIKGPLAS
jgi:hypothetical protein